MYAFIAIIAICIHMVCSFDTYHMSEVASGLRMIEETKPMIKTINIKYKLVCIRFIWSISMYNISFNYGYSIHICTICVYMSSVKHT